MEKKITCIICPRGCALTVNIENGNASVVGNVCPKGEAYGRDEALAPKRTVTSIIRVDNREDTMVSVKTSTPIPKEKMYEAMKMIRATTVSAPIKLGDVIISDLFGSEVIATKNVD